MADGSYGSPFYQGNMTPVEGNSTNKFATNMNRKKTKKWVEAKKINYDGSGWGDEDDEEDDGYGYDEPPAMPAMPTAPKALPSQQPPMPSQQPMPSQSQSTLAPGGVTIGGAHPTAAIRARNSPSPSGRIPLNVQTQQQQQPPQPQAQYSQQQTQPPQQAQQQPPQWRQASPAGGPRSGSQTPSSGNYTPWREGRSASPMGPRGQSQSPANVPAGVAPGPGTGPAGPRTMSPPGAGAPNSAGPNGPRANFIRPSEIYKRADSTETVDRGRKEQPGAPATSAIPATVPAAPVAAAPAASTTTTDTPQSPTHKTQDSVDSTASAEDAANDRRYSTSPKLPDLARFSTFSPELLFGGSGGGFLSSDAPPVPSIPPSPAVGSFQEAATTTTPSATTKPLTSVPEGVGSTSRNASPFSTSSGESISAPPPQVRDSAATVMTAMTDDTTSTAGGGFRGSADSTPSSVDAAATAADESRKSSSSGQEVPAVDTANASAVTKPDVPTSATSASASLTSPTSVYSTDPIAPLNPHRLSSMVPFMPPPVTTPKGPREMMRTETSSSTIETPTPTTAANSPVKESDMLREEIIRTLSPVKATHSEESSGSLEGAVTEAATGEASQQGEGQTDNDQKDRKDSKDSGDASAPAHNRTLTRESSYLQDVYDDYWTPDGDDASGNETYTASDPPPPIPPLASANSNAGATTVDSTSAASPEKSSVPALAAAVAATAAAGAAAGFAAGHSSSNTDSSTPTPTQQPPATHQLPSQQGHQLPSQQGLAAASSPSVTSPAPSTSPTPSASGLPGAFPNSTSNLPTPGATSPPAQQPAAAPATVAAQAAFSKAQSGGAPALRRRFSWEAEPEQPAAETGTGAFTAVRASTMAHVPSPPLSGGSSQSPPPVLGAAQVSSPVSSVPPPNDLRTISPHQDTNTIVSAVSTSTVAPELTAPSPVSDAAVNAAGSTTSPTAAADGNNESSEKEARTSQTQAPVRSMLDVGDAPTAPTPIRSMLDVGDEPLPKQLINRISTAESMRSATSVQSHPQVQPQAQLSSPTAAPSIHVYQPAAPAAVVSPTSAAAPHGNPALFGSGGEGSGQFLTLRQCMAFGSHHERMAKLTETRQEYAAADSGLFSWLQSMTSVPEYARAAYEPLFDGSVSAAGGGGSGLPSSAPRPVAAVAASISRVPHHVHVAVPSGTQISNKSKEIFSVATGKAGKGLLALRKKGFHKKSAN